MKAVIGVDPGATGALAALSQQGELLRVLDMPHHDGVVSPALIADWLSDLRLDADIAAAWVEDVHSMPKQGVASSFKFGRAFGIVCGVLGGARVPTSYVAPHVWKGALKVSKDKGTSRRRAIELWPDRSADFARVKDDGRAEAALIALYGIEQQIGRASA